MKPFNSQREGDPSFSFHKAEKSFAEKFALAGEKARGSLNSYRRGEACKLIGFAGKSSQFTTWLKDNSFLDSEECPPMLLVHEGLMRFISKGINFKPKFDCCNNILNGSEYDIGTRLRTVYTPLFTDKGIKYFQQLLSDPVFLARETKRIREYNTTSQLKLQGIYEPR